VRGDKAVETVKRNEKPGRKLMTFTNPLQNIVPFLSVIHYNKIITDINLNGELLWKKYW
jgi:hypothetical protein